MSMLKLLTTVGSNPLATYVDDVFSAYTYTGNGSTQTITNGIDLAGEGGMVWIKSRSNAAYHYLADTTRGRGYGLSSNDTGAQQAIIADRDISSFNSSGFSLGQDYAYSPNTNTFTFVSWTFRNADRFFSHSSVVKSSGSNATVSFPGLETLGMVAVKRTDSTGSWYVWHRSLTAGKLLYLEQTAAEATLGHITVSGTTVTLVNGVIADGTYIVYAWAHDTEADGIVQCGTYTGNGSTTGPVITLGWEPQYVLIKKYSATENWAVYDISRGIPYSGGDAILIANGADAESAYAGQSDINLLPTGFQLTAVSGRVNDNSQTYIYLAIRRPNKPPTVGTQVYNAIARTGNNALTTVTGLGFSPDLLINGGRTSSWKAFFWDRLRGAHNYVISATTAAEGTGTTNGTQSLDMDGFTVGTNTDGENGNTIGIINWCFKRAPGFFDEVCDTGTGASHTIAHNLTVAPELMIRKGRSGATQWEVWHSAIANTEKLILNSTAAKATDTTAWNSTSPTASVFTVGTGASVNTNTATYVTYLFATLSGISKCGTYTGNGTTQNIEMGFTTGARFFLVKATSTTGSWWIFDSVRGIIAGSDPYLLLNSTSAEDTDEDAVDPYSGGITVNETSASNINTNSVVYCYLAIA